MPVVYTTFFVEPTKVLKGGPVKWGEPIAFRATGGTIAADTPSDQVLKVETGNMTLSIGDEVVAFGSLQMRYGPEGRYDPIGAYWLTSEENSVWASEDGAYVNKGYTKDPKERHMDLATLERAVDQVIN